jgi:uncharacterized protein (TIGR02145 family)
LNPTPLTKNNTMKKIHLICVIVCLFLGTLHAQDLIYTVSGEYDNQAVPLDSILIENITNGTSISFGDLPEHDNYRINLSQKVLWISSGINSQSIGIDFYLKNKQPGKLTIGCKNPTITQTTVNVFNINGQKVFSSSQLRVGNGHSIDINIGIPGIFIVKVISGNNNQSFKAIGRDETGQIALSSLTDNTATMKSSQVIYSEDFSFQVGDSLLITAYKNDYYAIPRLTKIKGNDTLVFHFNKVSPDVSDIEGNTYKTVTIGTQTWMSENLKTTRYNDGVEIPLITEPQIWYYLKTPGYNWYNKDIGNKNKYGALYNWHTINTGKLCPTGWHVPKDAEWITLEIFMQNNGFNFDGTVDTDNDRETNNKIAKSLASTSKWKTTSEKGMIGNDLSSNNSSGFSALPGGFCDIMLFSNRMGESALWWTASDYDKDGAWWRSLSYDYPELMRTHITKTYGCSVRCVEGAEIKTAIPSVTTTEVSSITANNAITGGNITNDGGLTVTARGVAWSKSEMPTITTNEGITADGTGIGQFISHLTSLTPKTSYYVRAYATNSLGTSYGEQIIFSTTELPTFTVFDVDGNGYSTVTIGTQTWLSENLKTTKFNDGVEIPLTNDNQKWCENKTPAYCWYNREISNKDLYGALYNWHTVNTNKLCPAGWHVPKDDEWTTLEIYLENNGYNFDGTVDTDNDRETNNKIAKSLAATTNWRSTFGEGVIGFNTQANNSSGFNAYPGGLRMYGDGSFTQNGSFGTWWSASESNNDKAWYRILGFYNSFISKDDFNKNAGFSIRCVKD